MAKSPIIVDPQTRFIERYSFNNIDEPFSEDNASFHFKQNVRIMAIVFQASVPSYKDSFKVYRRFKGTEEVEFVEEIVVVPTVRDITLRFKRGYPIGICDELWFETSSNADKNVILEVAKWSL
jgi:hypothetical protein